MKKTLIFCFDDTRNHLEDVEGYVEGESITNILKLHVLFGGNSRDESTSLTDDSLHQQSFYYSGVGTCGGLVKKILVATFFPWYFDAGGILNAAIDDLRKHHQNGSHVLVFGFGKGAALARRFATVAGSESRIEDLKIDFLGVFDTFAIISETGSNVETRLASNVVFENRTMSQDVRKAVHLVALDENRTALQPTLFDYDSDRITEVWFPGAHSDVGGGHQKNGLSDLALDHIIKKIKQECAGYVRILNPGEVDYGQLNSEDDMQITENDINIKALVDGILHENKRETTSITAYRIAGVVAGAVAGVSLGITAALVAGTIAILITTLTASIVTSLIRHLMP